MRFCASDRSRVWAQIEIRFRFHLAVKVALPTAAPAVTHSSECPAERLNHEVQCSPLPQRNATQCRPDGFISVPAAAFVCLFVCCRALRRLFVCLRFAVLLQSWCVVNDWQPMKYSSFGNFVDAEGMTSLRALPAQQRTVDCRTGVLASTVCHATRRVPLRRLHALRCTPSLRRLTQRPRPRQGKAMQGNAAPLLTVKP